MSSAGCGPALFLDELQHKSAQEIECSQHSISAGCIYTQTNDLLFVAHVTLD